MMFIIKKNVDQNIVTTRNLKSIYIFTPENGEFNQSDVTDSHKDEETQATYE